MCKADLNRTRNFFLLPRFHDDYKSAKDLLARKSTTSVKKIEDLDPTLITTTVEQHDIIEPLVDADTNNLFERKKTIKEEFSNISINQSMLICKLIYRCQINNWEKGNKEKAIHFWGRKSYFSKVYSYFEWKPFQLNEFTYNPF